ncbi:hypothetical protein BDBG_16079 [Blastomyces gilchristii SLH14081]|uniref:Uncharacterized protein n=1 Tax=Blastomyces gilchristii (strain SLH14081) TaxID=559298 RepID=A0A179U6E9_BLAGS|nr:uncharacterized protein BDBG_16079 [Blastomyces gilchristii SLH14081]OAT03596.1 hypothetical protein BDBG_16079 [Blastomyces gilchristii SLH14081]
MDMSKKTFPCQASTLQGKTWLPIPGHGANLRLSGRAERKPGDSITYQDHEPRSTQACASFSSGGLMMLGKEMVGDVFKQLNFDCVAIIFRNLSPIDITRCC